MKTCRLVNFPMKQIAMVESLCPLSMFSDLWIAGSDFEGKAGGSYHQFRWADHPFACSHRLLSYDDEHGDKDADFGELSCDCGLDRSDLSERLILLWELSLTECSR